jgi:uncharacterized protein (DUF924 family)
MQTNHNPPIAQSIIDFWFEEISPKQWWVKSVEFDQLIRQRFLSLYAEILDGQHAHWLNSTRGCLARIIVLDQFSRNIFRDKTESFQTDALALAAAKHAINVGFDSGMPSNHKAFLYMPFMHSEALDDQEKAIELFGKFPHRNQILGRPSSKAEVQFLKQPGSRF